MFPISSSFVEQLVMMNECYVKLDSIYDWKAEAEMNNCVDRSRSWRRRRSSAGMIPLCKDERDCCVPLASQNQQQNDHQLNWHRRLSPVKRLPQLVRGSSFISNSKRNCSLTEKEKSPLHQKLKIEKEWKWKKNEQKKEGEEGKRKLKEEEKEEEEQITRGRRGRGTIKDHRLTNPPFSSVISVSAALDSTDDNNGICAGSSSPRHGAPSPEGMSSSFLISPAWYRDSDGRTGFRHDLQIPIKGHLQENPIKEKGRNGNTERTRQDNAENDMATDDKRSFARFSAVPIIHWPGSTPSNTKQWPQKQKVVKFAETIKINEIAPRLLINNSSIAFECSSAKNLAEENLPIWREGTEQRRKMDKRRKKMIRVEEEWERKKSAPCQHENVHFELLTDQFLRHCQSISIFDDSQQRSVYDNFKAISNDETTNIDSEKWLNSKTKVLAQRGIHRSRSKSNGMGREIGSDSDG
ncbi:hypothetical protein niasHT_010041 [Heterodera trifolii]|uniref:Uncharacterized protein n=1 Tax=Heterodera trifolii TaxID=157864 RepID=A0ABD2M8I3_9BILA